MTPSTAPNQASGAVAVAVGAMPGAPCGPARLPRVRARSSTERSVRSSSSPTRGSSCSSTTPTRSSKRSGSRSATTRRRSTDSVDAGAEVDGTRVRFPRGMCRQIVQAIGTVGVHAARPQSGAHRVEIGGDATVFAPNYGSPFVHDLDDGRRYATIADFENFVKLSLPDRRTCITAAARSANRSTCRSASGTSTWCTPTSATATSRSWGRSPQASGRPTRSRWRASRSAAISPDRTVMTSLINASSPLVWDGSMLEAAEVYATSNQACIITPFILAGAMAPATSAGVAAQTLAEALAGMTFTQLVRPGAPVVFGSFAELDVDAERCADVRHAGAGDRALHGGRARTTARRAVPVRRFAVCLEAARRPGGLRIRLDPVADRHGRCELRAPCSGLAGGWAGDRLREVRARLRPARRDGDLREGARPDATTVRRSTRSSTTRPASTSSAPPTRSPTSRRAFYRSTTADNNSYEQWSEEGGLDAAQRANARLEGAARLVRAATDRRCRRRRTA